MDWISTFVNHLRLSGEDAEALRAKLERIAREHNLDSEPDVVTSDPLRCLAMLAEDAVAISSLHCAVIGDRFCVHLLMSTNGDDETVVAVKDNDETRVICAEWVR